jgi:hypothetical protein
MTSREKKREDKGDKRRKLKVIKMQMNLFLKVQQQSELIQKVH